jgi:hypothetical protein
VVKVAAALLMVPAVLAARASRPEELLLWYGAGLSRNATIWGRKEPSEEWRPGVIRGSALCGNVAASSSCSCQRDANRDAAIEKKIRLFG